MEHPLENRPMKLALAGLVLSLVLWLLLAVLWFVGSVSLASLTSLVPLLIAFQQIGDQASIVQWYRRNYRYSLGYTVKLIVLGVFGKGVVPRAEALLPVGMIVMWCGSLIGVLTFLGSLGSIGTTVALGSMIVFEGMLGITLWQHR